MSIKTKWFFKSLGFLLVLFPATAWGYIGPGAGFAAVTSIFMVVASFLLALLGILIWPIRILKRKIKNRGLKKLSSFALKKKKVIILGIDGMEISLLRNYMDEGKLPNLSSLSKTGAFSTLGTTYPPESPVAWSSFLCGCNPGRHNIFDFLSRDAENYLPNLSMAEVNPPKWNLSFGKYKIPLSPFSITAHRKTKPFWVSLGERGVNCVALRVPSTFPPDEFPGVSLSAMGLPDLLGTQGTSSFYTSEKSDSKINTDGGVIIPVTEEEGTIKAFLRGPLNAMKKHPSPSKLPFSIKLNPDNEGAILTIDGETKINLPLKKFSSWVDVAFPMSLGAKVNGICKFYLNKVLPHVELYVTPINIDPENPALPISHPPQYSKYLAMATGKFTTLGLAEDTWMLNSGKLDEEAFLQHCMSILEERERVFFHELEKFKRGCFIGVFDTMDRIQHMFWRFLDTEHPKYDPKLAEKYKDVISDVYIKMDGIVAKVLEKVDSDTSLYIISDHGFKTFRLAMNVNSWLREEGYLVFEEGKDSCDKFFRGVDWNKSKAYALGLSGIYINLKGREKKGIVEPGAPYEQLQKEIIDKILDYRDPETGEKLLYRTFKFQNIYEGDYTNNSPDIVLGFHPGYRVSWKTALGGAPKPIVEKNGANWSGDHCMDPSFVPGVFLSNKQFKNNQPDITDLAPTVLNEFGLEIPEGMDGKVLQ
jgi:predicted AlkP superfamily phosphohydrolase/phosphomutase